MNIFKLGWFSFASVVVVVLLSPVFPGASSAQVVSQAGDSSSLDVSASRLAAAPTLLVVAPDTTSPALLSAVNVGNTKIRLTFSEPISDASASAAINYTVSGGISVSAAVLSADTTNVLLTVSPMNFVTSYTVTVNNIQDLAAPPNTIVPNSQASFLALELVPQGIGINGGAIQRVSASAFDITGAGTDIGGNSDQFQFAWEQRNGNFDLQTRVMDVTVSSPFLHAGLMARDTLDANASFAAIFGSSVELGCFFESRSSAGAKSAAQSIPGGFPVNYPYTWLRLRRGGDVFTGFASLDGQSWVQLGTATISLPSQL